MKKIILNILCVSAVLVSCERALDDTIEEINIINDSDPDRSGSTTEYTLTDDDYEAIVPSNNRDFYEEESAFISQEDAISKLPGIILERFGGKQNDEVSVNYNAVADEFVETAKIIDSLSMVSANILAGVYTLEDEDYDEGFVAFASNLDDSSIENELVEIIQNQFTDIQNGDRFYVTYNQFEGASGVIVEDFVTIFDNDTTNDWEIIDINGNIPENVWAPSAQFGNIQASAFSGGANVNEDWLVSPTIDLSVFTTPAARIEQQINFAEDNLDLVSILVANDYDGDVTSATWVELQFENAPDGTNGSDYVISELLDLSDFGNDTINIAFKYTATNDVSPRWRIRSFEIIENSSDDSNASFETYSKAYIYNDGGIDEFLAYQLTTEDYDSMGEGSDRPGESNTFNNIVLPENYIPILLENLPQFRFVQIEEVIFIGYNLSSSPIFPAWQRTENGYVEYNVDNFLGDEITEFQSTFVYNNEFVLDSGELVVNSYVEKTATPYELTSDDYDFIVDEFTDVDGFSSQVGNLDFFGNFNRNGGSTNWSDEQLEQALAVVLLERFPDAEEGDQYEVTYTFFRGGVNTESRILEFTADGEFAYLQ